MPEQTQIPRVLWAQRRDTVLLTVAVPDIEKVDVKFDEHSVSFNSQLATGNTKDKTVYVVKIDLFEKIDPEACKYENVGQKFWRILLKKKDTDAAFWPRLTKDKARLHWLQTDFDHWKDEDESDDEKAGFDGNFQDMFSGGMGGMDDMPDMGDSVGDDDDDADDDSDDEKASPITTESGTNGQTDEKSKISTNGKCDGEKTNSTSVKESMATEQSA